MIDYDPYHWASHLFDAQGSLVRQMVSRVLICTAWSALVVVGAKQGFNVALSPTTHTLVGVAVGLLMVFRTNASYDRFWEARRMWGAIINESRNLGRSLQAYVAPRAPDLALQAGLWTTAFARAVMHYLRDAKGLGPAAERLSDAEVAAALEAPNVPVHVAARLTEHLVAARDRGVLSDIALATLDQNVQQLIDYFGACERILRTPLPFVYVVHVRRALFLYCGTLPFAIVGLYGWWTILVVLLVAYTFFGIEEIGVEIENPFGNDANDLPLERFCQTVERDVLGVLGQGPLEPDPFSPHPADNKQPQPSDLAAVSG